MFCCSQTGVAAEVPDYEVLYFPITALGEPLRLTLAIGGLPFKDTTPKTDPNFGTRKNLLSPYGDAGQVPLLVVDGKVYPQCRATLTYLGKKVKYESSPLYPQDPREAYASDELIELIEDFRKPMGATFAIKDQAEKEAARAAMFAPDGPMTKWLKVIDKRLASDAMKKLTIGNIYAFCVINMFRQPTFLDGVPKDALAPYQNITKHHNWVASLPPVLAYYKDKDGIRDAFKPLA